ncbi:hypothetical protein BC567DRAFT_238037, partial [Phyllosticta citribraziliensis]
MAILSLVTKITTRKQRRGGQATQMRPVLRSSLSVSTPPRPAATQTPSSPPIYRLFSEDAMLRSCCYTDPPPPTPFISLDIGSQPRRGAIGG